MPLSTRTQTEEASNLPEASPEMLLSSALSGYSHHQWPEMERKKKTRGGEREKEREERSQEALLVLQVNVSPNNGKEMCNTKGAVMWKLIGFTAKAGLGRLTQDHKNALCTQLNTPFQFKVGLA